MKLPIAVLASLALGACASTMKTPSSPAQPVAGNQATSVAPGAAPAAAATPAAPDSPVIHWAKAHDYTLTTVGKRVLWCKEEVNIGSRIPQRTCLTEAQLTMILQTNEMNKQALLGPNNGCPSATCGKKGD